MVLIEDHALLAESVVLTLRASGLDAQCVSLGLDDLVAATMGHEPDLVLLDVLFGDDNKVALQALAEFSAAAVPVVMVTASNDRLLHARCVELGAIGIVEKWQPIEALINAVHQALRGETVMSKSKALELLAHLGASRSADRRTSGFETLTPREKEVLEALSVGHAAGLIARDHNTSVVTVRTHIRSILHKLEVHSQLDAVAMALRNGWVR